MDIKILHILTKMKANHIKLILILPILSIYGCGTIYEGGAHYIDDKECLSCGYAMTAPFNWKKKCFEPNKGTREILKKMMGEQYPDSCKQKDLNGK